MVWGAIVGLAGFGAATGGAVAVDVLAGGLVGAVAVDVPAGVCCVSVAIASS